MPCPYGTGKPEQVYTCWYLDKLRSSLGGSILEPRMV